MGNHFLIMSKTHGEMNEREKEVKEATETEWLLGWNSSDDGMLEYLRSIHGIKVITSKIGVEMFLVSKKTLMKWK